MGNDDLVALWQEQGGDGFRMSTEEIQMKLDKMHRCLRRRTIDGYLICATLILFFAGWMIVGMNTLQKAGAVLTMGGLAFLAWQIRANGFRGLPADDGSNTLEHLRRELARQRDFHRGARFWQRVLFFVPGPLVFFAGFAQQHPEVSSMIRLEAIAFVVIAIAAIPLNLWTARRYQKQIDALTRLQEES